MNIKPVETAQDRANFLVVHKVLNRESTNWICPIDQDINDVFDASKNKLFQEGAAKRWLLEDADGKLIGRIAAFITPKYTNKDDKQPTGGIGYFDCINNQEAADRLFNTAKDWLLSKGMQAMDGPINFGERNTRWGLLIKGFHPPVYGMNYNPPYYQELFDNYGFNKFYAQYCYDLDIKQDEPQQLSEKFYEGHAKFADNAKYYIKGLTKKNIRQFAHDFCEVYNKAWASHEGNKTLKEETAFKMFNKMKPIIKKNSAWLAYAGDMPVAMWVNMIDLNEIFKSFDGQFGLIQKLQLLYHLKFKPLTRLIGLVYGIIPEYQGTGIDRFMIVEAEKELKEKTTFNKLELQWIGDFNPKMNAIADFLEAEKSRELITYRYLFDDKAPFVRHPILG
jgi:hypothetical protein